MSRPRRYDAGARRREREHRGGDDHQARAERDGRRPGDPPQLGRTGFALDRDRQDLQRAAEDAADGSGGDEGAQLADTGQVELPVRVPTQQCRSHERRRGDRDGLAHDERDRCVVPCRRARGGEGAGDEGAGPRAWRRQQQHHEHHARGPRERRGEDPGGVEPPAPERDRRGPRARRAARGARPARSGCAPAGGGVRDDVDQRVLRARVARSDATNQVCRGDTGVHGGARTERADASDREREEVAPGPAGRTGPGAIGGKAGAHPRQHQAGAATWCRTGRPSRLGRLRRSRRRRRRG